MKDEKVWRKITSYNVSEKQHCEIHGIPLVQVPCSMYIYCPKCEGEKDDTQNVPE